MGAGFAGLTAARDLKRAGKSVVVLEARNRVGGRVLNKELGGGEESERGGTFIGPTQNRIAALAKDLEVDTFKTYNEGENVYYVDGERSTFSDTSPTGSAPTRPADPRPTWRPWSPASTRCRRRCRWTRPTRLRRRPSTTPRRSRPGSPTTASSERFRRARRHRHAADLRRRAARDLAAVHPLLHRRPRATSATRARSSATSTRAWARRSRASWAARRSCARSCTSGSASAWSCARPCRRIVQGRRGVRVESKRLIVRAKRVIVALPPDAGRADRLLARPAGPARGAHPARAPGHAVQGGRGL